MPSPASSSPTRIEPQRALHMGVGAAAAPTLWAAFFAAAGAGVTYWWMTAWTRGQFAAKPAEAKSFAPAMAEETAAAPEPVIAAFDATPQEVMEHSPVDETPPAEAEIVAAKPLETPKAATPKVAKTATRKSAKKSKA